MVDLYHFIIVGAGTAGLTAAIVATKLNRKVLVLEKGDKPAPKPRGETIHHYALLDEILGKDFLPLISKHDTPNRLFHSPKNKFQSHIKSSSTSYVFEWEDFIARFNEKIKEFEIEIRCNCEVTEPIIENNVCIGVKYRDINGAEQKALGNTILACDGYNSTIGSQLGVDYKYINNPMVKCLVNQANINIKEQSALELFLVTSGELTYAPNFPPCALFMFPRGGKEIEIGLMIFSTAALSLKDIYIPDKKEIKRVWNEIKNLYPGFNTFLKGAEITYEELTGIGSANMTKKYLPYPGVVLIGDSAGFVEASGSSGLYSSMAMADFWVRLIYKELGDLPENNEELIKINKSLWTKEYIDTSKKLFRQTEIFKHITKTYQLFNSFLKSIFVNMRTAENINEKWDFLATLLQKAKSE